jgi:hypothetical protein
LRILGPDGIQYLDDVILIKVPVFENIFRGSIGSLKEGVVGELINDHVVVFLDQGFYGAVAGEPPRGVDERLAVPELGDFVLELHVVPGINFKILGCSEGERTAGRVNSKGSGGLSGGLDGGGVF